MDLLPTKAETREIYRRLKAPGPFPGRARSSPGITHRSADFLRSAFRRLRPSHSTESVESQAGVNDLIIHRDFHPEPGIPGGSSRLPPLQPGPRLPARLQASPRRSTKPPQANSESSISDVFGRFLMSSRPRRRGDYDCFRHSRSPKSGAKGLFFFFF